MGPPFEVIDEDEKGSRDWALKREVVGLHVASMQSAQLFRSRWRLALVVFPSTAQPSIAAAHCSLQALPATQLDQATCSLISLELDLRCQEDDLSAELEQVKQSLSRSPTQPSISRELCDIVRFSICSYQTCVRMDIIVQSNKHLWMTDSTS